MPIATHHPHDALILAVDPREDTSEQLQERVDPKTKERIMSAAEKLIQQGRQQGMQQEKLAIAKSMLKDQEPIEKMARWTGLGLDAIKKLQG